VTGVASMAGSIVKVNPLAGLVIGSGSLVAVSASSCIGTPTFQPAGQWDGYNDGCIHVYPIILFGPPKPPV
jgi:hypothetical protein